MFTIEEIVRATGGEVFGVPAGNVSGVSTDSRTVEAGELFVPLKGGRFDGHDFIATALARGIRVFLADRGWRAGNEVPADATCIAVADTLRGLGDLALFHRRRFSLPVVGITGSNGKTTTKEMLASILTRTAPGLKTGGNLNNLIGLPQMLLQLTREHRWAVLEMGMSEPGEIDRLAELARPDVGVITNALPAHLESMGSVEAVAEAKGELFLRLQPGGWAVYNADDLLISRCPSPSGVHRLSFGIEGAAISATAVRSEGVAGQSFTLRLPNADIPVRLTALGLHNIYTALAAAAAAAALGIAPEIIREGLETFTPVAKRFSPEKIDGIVLIDDSYNANPASMAAALVTLREIGGEASTIAVLGDMLELGEGTAKAHREVGRLAATCVNRLYLLGSMAETMAEGAMEGGLDAEAVTVAACHNDIIAELGRELGAGEYLLVKGSRGMRMETVAEGIRRRFAPQAGKGDN